MKGRIGNIHSGKLVFKILFRNVRQFSGYFISVEIKEDFHRERERERFVISTGRSCTIVFLLPAWNPAGLS